MIHSPENHSPRIDCSTNVFSFIHATVALILLHLKSIAKSIPRWMWIAFVFGSGLLPNGLANHASAQDAKTEIEFDRYFHDKTLRFELFLNGCTAESKTTLHRIVEEPIWSGNTKQLVFPFPYGDSGVRVYDAESNMLIYSFGFDTLFKEYSTTKEAKSGTWRTFPISIRIPKPKSKFRIEFQMRRRDLTWQTVWQQEMKPSSNQIRRETPQLGDTVIEIQKTGAPHDRYDLVFVAEGYSASEHEKFKMDLERMVQFMFEQEPYRKLRARFNIHAIHRPSVESGIDQPDKRIYRNTALNASFGALGMDRYLLAEDEHLLHQVAAQVP